MATVRTLISCECMPSQMSPGLNGRRHQQQPQPSLHEYQISLELIFSMLKRKVITHLPLGVQLAGRSMGGNF